MNRPPLRPLFMQRRRMLRRYEGPGFEERRRALTVTARECLPWMLGFGVAGRKRALGVLGHVGGLATTRVLLGATRGDPDSGTCDADPMTRRLAVQGLGLLGRSRHRDAARVALLAAVADEAADGELRRQAIQALRGHLHRDVAGAMAALAAGPVGAVRSGAEQWLAGDAGVRERRRKERRRLALERARRP